MNAIVDPPFSTNYITLIIWSKALRIIIEPNENNKQNGLGFKIIIEANGNDNAIITTPNAHKATNFPQFYINCYESSM